MVGRVETAAPVDDDLDGGADLAARKAPLRLLHQTYQLVSPVLRMCPRPISWSRLSAGLAYRLVTLHQAYQLVSIAGTARVRACA